MSRSPFGWSYPAGAESDPNAPWNQDDMPTDYCEACDTNGHPKTEMYALGRVSEQWCPECINDDKSFD